MKLKKKISSNVFRPNRLHFQFDSNYKTNIIDADTNIVRLYSITS